MSTHPYQTLTPDRILDAVEAAGFRCDGRMLALNSYENRVYMIWLDDGERIVAKFYRPGRWTEQALREEHGFALELARREIPVVAPLPIRGDTLASHEGFQFALYPRRPGRSPSSRILKR